MLSLKGYATIKLFQAVFAFNRLSRWVSAMRFDRFFTRTSPDPYEGVAFRTVLSEDGYEQVVPAAWDEPAVALLQEQVFGRFVFPRTLAPVEQRGVPPWLCPRTGGGVEGGWGGETDIRQVIDRMAGFWTWRVWQSGACEGDEENARALYDELRHMLLHRLLTPPLSDWQLAGVDWAYGLAPPLPLPFRLNPPLKCDITDPDALSKISRKTREIFDRAALEAGRRLLLRHLDAVMESYGTASFGTEIDKARANGVGEGALSDAVLYAKQGYKAFPAFEDEETHAAAEGEVFRTEVSVTDLFMRSAIEGDPLPVMGDSVAGSAPSMIDAPALWKNLAGAVWSSGDPVLRFDDGWSVPDEGMTPPRLVVNLPAFVSAREGAPFALEAFRQTCRISTVVLDAGVHAASASRALGLGFAGLETFLSAKGAAWDSEQGRALASSVLALMSGMAWQTSAEMASMLGGFPRLMHRRQTFLALINKTALRAGGAEGDGVRKIPALKAEFCPDLALVQAAELSWATALSMVERDGARNASVTAFSEDRDCDTLLGVASGNQLRPLAELRMAAACQSFLSGDYEKTVVLPRDIAVGDVADIMQAAWALGARRLALYREGCEMQYPFALLETATSKSESAPKELVVLSEPPGMAVKETKKKKKANNG